MEREQSFNVPSSSPVLVLPASTARKGFMVQNLEASNPVLVRVGKAPALAVVAEVQTLDTDVAPTAGAFKIKTQFGTTASIAYNATNAQIQAALRLIPGLGSVTVTGTLATLVTITFTSAPVPMGLVEIVESTLVVTGTACVQSLAFSNNRVPSAGFITLLCEEPDLNGYYLQKYESEPIYTAGLTAASLQASLRNMFNDSGLTVSGDWDTSFTITFSELKPRALMTVDVNKSISDAVSPSRSLTFDNVPVSGQYDLLFGEELIDTFDFDATAADIQESVQLVEGYEEVTVDGDVSTAIMIRFVGFMDDGVPEVTIENNTLEDAENPVNITVDTGDTYAPAEPSTFILSMTTPGVKTVAIIPQKSIITTPGDDDSLNYSVSGGATLDKSSSGTALPVYVYAAAGAAIKVIEK